MMNRKALVPSLFVCVASSTGSAHDLWLVPTTTKPPVGASVKILAQTGMELGKSLAALAPDRIEAFFLQDSEGRQHVTPQGTEQNSLVATVRPPRAGVAVAALAIKPRLLKLKAEDFNHYLEEDGAPPDPRRRGGERAGARRAIGPGPPFADCRRSIGPE